MASNEEFEMKKVLIINAHQFYDGISSGKLNSAVAELIQQEMAQRGYAVQQTSIEQGYDLQEEVEKQDNNSSRKKLKIFYQRCQSITMKTKSDNLSKS